MYYYGYKVYKKIGSNYYDIGKFISCETLEQIKEIVYGMGFEVVAYNEDKKIVFVEE